MEPVAKWLFGFEGFLATLQATEWVGVGVLLCALMALWTSVAGSKPGWYGPSARTVGLVSLSAILVGIWFGISIHLLIGAVILGSGCILSLWSLLLRIGISWRQHIRPAITPTFLILLTTSGMWFAPRVTIFAMIIVGYWTRGTIRRATHAVDQQLNSLSTRALALTNYEAADYLTNAWFQRFAPHASNLTLLALAAQARERTHALPRARRIMHASDAFLRLATYAEGAVDQRLRTDAAAARNSSWIRVLTLEFVRQTMHRSGLVAFFGLISDLLLAIPPQPRNLWDSVPVKEGSVPDPEGYAVALIADMPPAVMAEDLSVLRDRVTRDSHAGGREWLTRVATRAECLREETPNPERDLRIEIVAEVLWGVYESSIGPRPSRYDLYDQVRLQTPELVERSAVREVRVERESLIMQLDGMPRAFHELGRGNPVLVHTPDDMTWSFRRLETTDAGVMLFFSPYSRGMGDLPVPKRGPGSTLKLRREVPATLAAAAGQ